MKYYTFVQNNSGGFFTGPAQYVIVEAQNADDANARAEAFGLYFDGASEDGPDCPCCGDRWYPQFDDDEGTDEPRIYDMLAEGSGRDYVIVHADQ